MEGFKSFKAKTVADAITKACLEFGVTSEHLEYRVVNEGSNGFLGLFGGRDAEISARRKEVKPVEEPKAKEEKKPAPAKKDEQVKKEAPKKAEAPKKEAAAKKEPVVKEEVKKVEKAVEEPKAAAPEANGPRVLTMDEIERRAAAAAARAEAEGVTEEAPVEKRERRRDGRDRGRGRRNDRRREGGRDSRQRRSFEEKTEEVRETAPVTPSKPRPERVVNPKTEEEVAEMKAKASEFLSGVFGAMGISVETNMEYDQKECCLCCSFSGDDMGILIGKRGQTLDSLQYLTSLVINKNKNDYTRVKLDTEDYRARRADTLENLARNIAFKVKRSHRAVALEPMNPYERRIIHSALQGNRYVETYSEGEEPYRHVVVAPKR